MMIARAILFLAVVMSAPAHADTVKVENAWVRATAPGQKVAGAFMNLTADADVTLIAAESSAARLVELHTMRLEGGIMTMRPVKNIALAKGQTVQLKPGGLHVMLIDIVAPIKEGETTPLTLVVEAADGTQQRVPVAAMARRFAGMGHPQPMR